MLFFSLKNEKVLPKVGVRKKDKKGGLSYRHLSIGGCLWKGVGVKTSTHYESETFSI